MAHKKEAARRTSKPHKWSKEEKEDFDLFWNKSILPISQIAERLNKTIGMLAGAARRLGWSPRPSLEIRRKLQGERYGGELQEEEEVERELRREAETAAIAKDVDEFLESIQPFVRPIPTSEVAVTYWDSRAGRYVFGPVTLEEYYRLWDEKRLGFVREGKPKPAHLPDYRDKKSRE